MAVVKRYGESLEVSQSPVTEIFFRENCNMLREGKVETDTQRSQTLRNAKGKITFQFFFCGTRKVDFRGNEESLNESKGS